MEVDLEQHLGRMTREVRATERDGQPAMSVVARRTYDTSIADLWDAVTSPERIPGWFLPVTGDLRVGGRFQLEGNAGGEILECEPPRRLSVTWEFGGEVTWVELDLSEVEPGLTALVLQHTAPPGDHWAQFGPGATGVGWDQALLGLEIHIGGAPPVDHAEAIAWAMSDEGKRFVEETAAGWGEAAIAAGEDAETAKASAERTRAFYTGEAGPPEG